MFYAACDFVRLASAFNDNGVPAHAVAICHAIVSNAIGAELGLLRDGLAKLSHIWQAKEYNRRIALRAALQKAVQLDLELLLDGVHDDPCRVLQRLASGRLLYVALKRAARGGILYDIKEDRVHAWEPRTTTVVDQTGAGDAFGIGFVLAHLEGLSIEACLQRAIVTASFAVSDWGPAGLLSATAADAGARWREWYGEVKA